MTTSPRSMTALLLLALAPLACVADTGEPTSTTTTAADTDDPGDGDGDGDEPTPPDMGGDGCTEAPGYCCDCASGEAECYDLSEVDCEALGMALGEDLDWCDCGPCVCEPAPAQSSGWCVDPTNLACFAADECDLVDPCDPAAGVVACLELVAGVPECDVLTDAAACPVGQTNACD